MASGPRELRLKVGPHRSVSRVDDPVHGPVVIKRYHSRGFWRRLGDRFRARGEMRRLQLLHRAGLAVPEPLSCARESGTWCLRTRAIADACKLSDLLHPLAAPMAPALRNQLARRLGQLVGRAHGLGLDHGDLHGGNLLIDGDGAVWLIDVPKARLRSSPGAEVLERDLVTLNAEAREFVPVRVLLRFWVAWRREFLRSAPSNGDSPGRLADRELLERVDARAPLQRRESLKQHQDRWLRESGVLEAREYKGKRILVAKHTAADAWFENETQHIFTDTVNDEVFHAWKNVGRAWQHGLPCMIPLYLEPGSPPRAVYLLPRALAQMGLALNWRNTDLFAALRERQLDLAPRSQPNEAGGGALLFGPRCRLVNPRMPDHG